MRPHEYWRKLKPSFTLRRKGVSDHPRGWHLPVFACTGRYYSWIHSLIGIPRGREQKRRPDGNLRHAGNRAKSGLAWADTEVNLKPEGWVSG